MSRSWKVLADNISHRSKSSTKKKSQLKFQPLRHERNQKNSKIFHSLINQSRSKMTSFHSREDERQLSIEKGSCANRSHYSIKNNESQNQFEAAIGENHQNIFGSRNKKNTLQEEKNSRQVRKELQKLKKEFKKFQDTILGQLLRQQRIIQKIIRETLDCLTSFQHQKKIDKETISELKFQFKIKDDIESRITSPSNLKLNSQLSKIKFPQFPENSKLSKGLKNKVKDKIFQKFFETMEKIKDNLDTKNGPRTHLLMTPKRSPSKLNCFKTAEHSH